MPQLYHKNSDDDGSWTKDAQKAVSQGLKYFLSYGEPGTPGDQQMNPQEAAQQWMIKLEPYAKQGVSIGAPGTLQNTQDFDWLNQFLTACKDCTIGFIAQHWFGSATSVDDALKQVPGFQQTLQKAKAIADQRNVFVWLDNFSMSTPTGTSPDLTAEIQTAFLKQTVPWLEQQDWIKAYAYVPPDVATAGAGGSFIKADGSIDTLGSLYASM